MIGMLKAVPAKAPRTLMAAESIHERQKSRMIEDVSGMLARHFTEAEIGEVAALVNQLFERNWAEKTGGAQSGSTTAPRGLTPAQRRRLREDGHTSPRRCRQRVSVNN